MVSIIEKLKGAGRTKRNAMDASSTSARNSREVYWMNELRTVVHYGPNDRTGDEPKITEINVGIKSRVLPRKHRLIKRKDLS